MTVATSTSKSGPYAGAGTTGPFTVTFRFLENSHLQVIKTSTAGIDSTLALTTDYAVSGAGASTGTVTLMSALLFGEKLTIIRNVPFTQEADYVQNDAFPAESHERALDKLTMETQQLKEQVDRALVLPATVSGVSTRLPTPAGNKLVGWNESGSGLQNFDSSVLATIVAYGTAKSDIFTGDGITTAFALTDAPGSLNNLDVAIGGVTQLPGIDYTWIGGTIVTFTSVPPIGAKVLVRYMQGLPFGTSSAADVVYNPPFTGAVPTNVEEKLAQTVSVKDFGAVGDGVTDDTAAIQEAINYCKSKLTSVNNSSNGGSATLFFPQGFYVVSSTLNVSGVVGFRMLGEGNRTTQIVFIGSSSALFYYTAAIYCNVENIMFTTGPVSFSGGLPQIVAPVTKNNRCFRFNGTSGGTEIKFENCMFFYWDRVFTTVDSIVNDDSHHHYNCQFIASNIVWDNTNTQAVIWSFTDCKIFSTAVVVFKNPGYNLSVRGGDYINPGIFLESTLTSLGGDSSFTDLRFENYQNIDPTSAPRLLVLSGSHSGLVFDRCSARGGGSLAGKTSATISGGFNIIMRDCESLSGNWEITVSSAVSNITSLLVLDNTILTVNQTLSGGVGNRPLNINYINYPNSAYGRINRYFQGALPSQTLPISATPMVDSVAFQSAVNNSTASKSVPVFVPAPYALVLSSVKFTVRNNTPSNFDLIVWKDSTKAVKLCESLGLNANGVNKVFTATPTTWPTFTSTSDPLFVEVTSTLNAGTVSGNLSFEYTQTF